MLLDDNNHRTFSRSDLDVLNLLQHPVWIFDIPQQSMYWANQSALDTIWKADSLETLLKRDFRSDMTEATNFRLQEHFAKISRGEIVQEQWTFYPNKAQSACTVRVTESAIRIEGNRIGNLVEAELPNAVWESNTVRGVEMLRHLNFPICLFSLKGDLVYQNPEALTCFGISEPTMNQNEEQKDDPSSDFLRRFVDKSLGQTILKQVQAGRDYSVEAEQFTQNGKRRWFSVSARRTRDPVTSKQSILYSAQDIAEIIQARLDSRQANLKSEFLSVIAHELRTPLHQIVGYMDLFELTKLSKQQGDCVQVMQSSTSLLMAIINDLLDYSKLESGKLKIETVNFELVGVFNACLDAVRARVDERKGLRLEGVLEPNVAPSLVGDPNRLRQILLNLLSNAVKFTESGTVELSVCVVEESSIQQRIRFVVRDTGIGIDPALHTDVFEAYRQASASMTRQYGGTGLGLAICKSLTEAMGGTIDLQSELGQGTAIAVEIPFPLPNRVESRTNESQSSTEELLSKKRTKQVRLHILVAEDNKVNQKVARSMLQRIGHDVTIVENGQLALDELKQNTYDLVLMDVQMPVMDGIQATKKIRTDLALDKSQLPILGLTASFQYSDLDYYRNIGMNDCLGKPLKLIALQEAVSNAVHPVS